MKCAVTACNAEAHPLLIHSQDGRLYCPRCARRINEANHGLNLIPWPTPEEIKMRCIQGPVKDNEPIPTDWVKQPEWHGNPELGLDSYLKRFPNPHNNNRRVPVYVFGIGNKWSFVVSAGANSDFSYSGCCKVGPRSAVETMKYVDSLAQEGKLFK